MPDQTPTDDQLREIVETPDSELLPDEMVGAMAAELLAARARIAELQAETVQLRERRRTWLLRYRDAQHRITELEAAQPAPAGWQDDDGRVRLELDETENVVTGARTRAHATTADALAFLAECGPQDARTEFRVYGLRPVSCDDLSEEDAEDQADEAAALYAADFGHEDGDRV